jgi:hypothetical protein
VVNLAVFVPLAAVTFVRPSLGLAGLWGAQMAWMVMRAWWTSVAGVLGRGDRSADGAGVAASRAGGLLCATVRRGMICE